MKRTPFLRRVGGTERYEDTMTERKIAVGRHGNVLVMVPYEIRGNEIIPVTVHATDRKQITARVRSGRLSSVGQGGVVVFPARR